MDVYGCLWMFMDVYGCSWMFMDVLWMFMDAYGCLWMFMDVYGTYNYKEPPMLTSISPINTLKNRGHQHFWGIAMGYKNLCPVDEWLKRIRTMRRFSVSSSSSSDPSGTTSEDGNSNGGGMSDDSIILFMRFINQVITI